MSITKTCIICGNIFEARSHRTTTCSKECGAVNRKNNQAASNNRVREVLREKNNEKYRDVLDIPTCKLCGWKSMSLSTHFRSHELTIAQYREQFNITDDAEIFHASYTETKRNRMKGDKNPGYQHGGTMSSYSKHNRKYEGLSDTEKEDKIKSVVRKANKTKQTNHSYTTTLEYYMSRGATREEAVSMRAERQRTFSLKKCIEELGEEAGTARWQARQDMWQYTLDQLSDEEKERINEAKKFAVTNGYSQVSLELFDVLSIILNIKDAQYGEYEGYVNISDCRSVKPDFLWGNKIIEFNGDLWHANPAIYKADDDVYLRFSSTKKLFKAHEIWEKDKIKLEKLRKMGYSVLVVWQQEYKNNKEGVIQECLRFLKESNIEL